MTRNKDKNNVCGFISLNSKLFKDCRDNICTTYPFE